MPALRLVLPPLPQLAPDLYLPPAILFIPTAAEMAAPLPAEAGPGQWVPFMLAMWAGGAVIFLVLQWLAYRAFLGRIRETSRPARPPLFGGIRTWISDSVDGPLAIGVLERRIVLPGDFSRRYNPAERRLALEHELVHHRRGDIWWNLAAMLVLALFWFNPVAWLAFRAFRSDQELACDAAVARKASLDERCDYARALVKSASRPGLIAACALNPAGELKRRLRMMRAHRASRLRSAGGVAALGAFAAAGLALGSAQPSLPGAPLQLASAPAAAAPVRPAAPARAEPAVVVTARRAARASAPAASKLEAEPMSFAAAEAPVPLPTTLASMPTVLRHLPRTALAPRAPHTGPDAALAALAPARMRVEGHLVQLSADGTRARVFVVGGPLSPADAEELRKAVGHAVAESRKVRFRAERRDGGSGEGIFDVNVQTLVKGE